LFSVLQKNQQRICVAEKSATHLRCRKISNASALLIFLQHGCTWYKTHEFQRRALQRGCVAEKSATRMRC
jgi:hypothetical protein